jgi:hypothetical protein
MGVWSKIASAVGSFAGNVISPVGSIVGMAGAGARRDPWSGEESTAEVRKREEAAKRTQVEETEREQKNLLGYAKTAQGTSTYLTGEEKRGPLLAWEEASRQHLQGAAESGTIHSGSLGMARRSAARQNALQEASLQYEDERRERARLMEIEQMRAVVEQGREKIPSSVVQEHEGAQRRVTLYKTERERIAATDKEIQRIISELDKRRPSPEEMRGRFTQEVNASYDELKQQAMAEAKNLGMSADYIAGIGQGFDQDRQRALGDIESFVGALSAPDPAQTQALLASMYTPDTIEPLTQAKYDPWGALIFGGAGLALGAYLGGPVGAAAGWSAGSQVGDVVAGQRYLG